MRWSASVVLQSQLNSTARQAVSECIRHDTQLEYMISTPKAVMKLVDGAELNEIVLTWVANLGQLGLRPVVGYAGF